MGRTDDSQTGWQPVMLDGDGTSRVLLEVVQRGGRENVSVLDSVPLEQITSVVTKLARGVLDAVVAAQPDKASVELGLEFGMESGSLVAIVARGTATANVKVTMEWQSGGNRI